MIVYSLRCAKGHVFDEWFGSSADYDRRAAAGELSCPDCGDKAVSKAIMAPNVGNASGGKAEAPAPCGQPACAGGACAFANDF